MKWKFDMINDSQNHQYMLSMINRLLLFFYNIFFPTHTFLPSLFSLSLPLRLFELNHDFCCSSSQVISNFDYASLKSNLISWTFLLLLLLSIFPKELIRNSFNSKNSLTHTHTHTSQFKSNLNSRLLNMLYYVLLIIVSEFIGVLDLKRIGERKELFIFLVLDLNIR